MLRAHATWHLLRRLRAHAEPGRPTLHAADRARDVLAEAARFLHALREHDHDLSSCTQADLDGWLTSRAQARRLLPGFLTWAKQQHHLPALLIVPATPAWQLGAVQPADQRWQLARKLLHDNTLPAPDRVAGLVVLLYGQTLTCISRLGRADLDTDARGGRLRLSSEPITVDEPLTLTTLLQSLPAPVTTRGPRPRWR